MNLFSIPDFIAGWRNSNLLQKVVTVAGMCAGSFWIGFAFTAGAAWAQGTPFLIGLGGGMVTGSACMAAVCIALRIPIAYPKEELDKIANVEVRKE